MVSGTPSTINLMPLIPKFALDPNPLMDILESCAKLLSFEIKTPGTLSIYSLK
ncbi:hypothetical protein OAI38_02180 [Flavobacteriaceae bacterium]|nr:hypothetical protein [Flavobacteriaceae bacterium]